MAHANALCSTLIDALAYHHAGRCVFPVAPGTKWPSVPHGVGTRDIAWRKDFPHGPTRPQLDAWWESGPLLGISIVTGVASGVTVGGERWGLELLDIDNAATWDAFHEQACFLGLADLLSRLVTERTPGGGGHLGYLCPAHVLEGNLKLARFIVDDGRPQTAIETRGQGGQVVVAPTPPGIHPDIPMRGYVAVCGSWEEPPLIRAEERQALFDLARSFNTYVAPEHVDTTWTGAITGAANGSRPGDKLNAAADASWWQGLLETHGWTLLRARGVVQYWQRAGKEGAGCSATLGACGPFFYVFSSNADPFEAERAYSAFGAYTLLEHAGNFEASARALGQAQRGTPFAGGSQPGMSIPPPAGLSWAAAIRTTKAGNPLESFGNLLLIFRHTEPWASGAWYDEVRQVPMLGDTPLNDQRLGEAAVHVEECYNVSLKSLRVVELALTHLCRERPRDLLQEFIGGLPPWDGTARLETWLIAHAGAKDTAYSRDVSRLLLVGMVARALEPGCQFRPVPIFEGAEDVGKSKLCKLLAGPEWYREVSHGLEGKEAHMVIQGVWLAELAELSSLSRTEEARLKSFITMEADDYVPKFSNLPVTRKRRTVFVGTTNPDADGAYLRGQTGNTRFLPVALAAIDHEAIAGMRLQLFAEARAYLEGHQDDWWQLSTEGGREAGIVRELRRQASPYEGTLQVWLATRIVASWEDIARDYLLLDAKEKWKDKALQMEVAKAMRALGWESAVRRQGAKTIRVWVPR